METARGFALTHFRGRQMRDVCGADGDIVGVVELDLSRDAANLVVLDRPDRPIDRRHREQAIEERQLLLARRDFVELARDDEVLGAAMAEVLSARDPHDQRRPFVATGRRASPRSRSISADSSSLIS